MKWRATLWMLMLGLALPVQALADDGEPNKEAESKTEKVAEKDKDKEKEKESPILRLAEMRLDEFVVPARMINLPLPGKTRTLQEILDKCEEWSKDKNIGAVLLDLGDLNLTLPDIEELRASVARLKKAEKKVLAFVNAGGPEAYLLACAADEIAIAPTGGVIIPGLGRLFPFMKGYYQMLGLEFEVITAGRFKYPGFMNEREPNQYFKEEFNAILDGWFADYKAIIAQGRHLSEQAVSEAVDIALFDANQAQQRGLVDTIAYYDEYRERVLRREKMKRYGGEERGLTNVNSLQDLVELINESLEKAAEARKAVGPKIAVLHARGPIVDLNLGAGFASQMICRDDFVKVVEELRTKDEIKAVVMRVDSPGGSGYASDVIWQALHRLDETKPLVVSMGSVAGSGGYYIACPARRIFAQPTTITGSIGVLGVFRSAWSMYNRMDFELAEMKRGARSLLGAPHRPLSKEDHDFIQKWMDDFYGIFISRVAQTRKIPAEEVRKIAEGRIYTGRQALEIGLVDELGGLAEAVESARTLANIPPSAELKIVHYPRPGSLGEIFESLSGMGAGPAGASQVLEAFRKGVTAAPSITFDEQLMMFSRRPQPLCWMAVPEFCEPSWGREPALEGWSPPRLPADMLAP
ncbi:MAG: signal peptide peptidase SppA [Planctomycetota bacterium]